MLDAVAQRYGCRPSEILRDDWWAYDFDRTVMTIAIDMELRRNKKRGILPLPKKPKDAPKPKAERVAGALGAKHIRSVAIPEDGIW